MQVTEWSLIDTWERTTAAQKVTNFMTRPAAFLSYCSVGIRGYDGNNVHSICLRTQKVSGGQSACGGVCDTIGGCASMFALSKWESSPCVLGETK